MKCEAEGREFAKFLRSLQRSEQFLVTKCFFNLLLEVSHIYNIRTIRIQIGKKFGIEKHVEKVRKRTMWSFLYHDMLNKKDCRTEKREGHICILFEIGVPKNIFSWKAP